jgi:5'-nucleotidase
MLLTKASISEDNQTRKIMSTQNPTILITNDDGIDSPGLWAAADALAAIGNVWVVAPREQYTSAGRSTPPASDERVEKRTFRYHDVSWTGYAVGGSPAQAVLLAVLGILPKPPDLIVAGINYGLNIGSQITNSGTLGAAFEAADMKIPALAISLETSMDNIFSHSNEVDFSVAAHFTAFIARLYLATPRPFDVHVIKVEVPSDATPGTAWELTRLSPDPFYIPSLPPEKAGKITRKISFAIQPRRDAFLKGTDAYAVMVKRVVSVTPISVDMTSRVDMCELERQMVARIPRR